MIFQDLALRFFLVYSIQTVLFVMFVLFIILLLKRKQTVQSFLLSSYFGLFALGLVLDAIATAYRVTPMSLFLYAGAVYVIFLGLGFLVLFTFFLVYRKAWKFGLAYICTYAILIIILHIMPNAIQYSVATNWIPVWSLELLVWGYLLYSLFVVGPELFLFFKLYKSAQQVIVKKKVSVLLLGVVIQLISIYPIGIYNAFPENEMFRAVWSVLTFILVPASGVLIYFVIGRNLE